MARIRVIDLETTSLDDDAKPVEIGWCDVFGEDGGEWSVGMWGATLVNPGIPIAPGASAVHHIIDADLVDAIPWPEAWRLAVSVPEQQPIDAFAAHAAKFERRFIGELSGAVPWICTLKMAWRLWPQEASHSNGALRYSRKPAGLIRHKAEPAHRAGPDAYVTAHHLRDALTDPRVKVEHLIRLTEMPGLMPRCQTGKFYGKPWAEVDEGFMRWMLDKDFDEDTLHSAKHELKKRSLDSAGETT